MTEPRLPLVDPATVSEEERALLLRGSPLKLKHVVAHARGVLVPLYNASGALLESSELDPLLRELVILQAAALAGSEYEWVQHVPRALELGVTQEQIETIRAGGRLPGAEGTVVAYVRDLFAGEQPDDARLEEVLGVLSVAGVVSAIVLAGIYTTFARVIEAAGLPPETPVERAGSYAPT